MSENKAWSPVFTPTFREHLLWWAKKAVRPRVGDPQGVSGVRRTLKGTPSDKGMLTKTDKSKINKIFDLVEVTCQQPFKGIGKPEPLKYIDSNIWSRRINLEHRLVYRIKDNRIYFLQCRYHYE